MLEFGACPQCKLDISEERKRLVPFICNHCGFTSSNDDKVQSQIEKRNIVVFSLIGAFIIAAHIQLANWDRHSIGILPIAIKETIGGMNSQDWEAKAEMCMDLKKWDCVEAAYVKVAQSEPTQWQRAGDFQMKRAHWNQAAHSYYSFFQNGGESLDVSYNYARALAKLGKVDEAVQYFDQVLAAKPDVLQVTVVTNYVQLLMDHQRYDQAKVLISKVRAKSGPAGESFMDDEFKKIKDMTTASRE